MSRFPALVLALSAVLAAAPTPTATSSTLSRPAFVPCPVAAPGPAAPADAAHPAAAGTGQPPAIGGEGLDTVGLAVPAQAPAPPGTLSARSWLVADLDSGAVLGACGPHAVGAPASVQKLLLAATLLPKLDPAQVVEVTPADLDFEPGSSAVGLMLGGHYPVRTLWLGLLLNSGNDAANTLARIGGGAGGVPGTMEAMNAEARRLGAYDTHAVTPSGLDALGQQTSAYDLALIGRACFAREDFRGYIATPRAQIPAQPPRDPTGYQIQNDNQLLYQYPGALGGKTGFTDVARHTYVGAAERNGRRLLVTLLGAEITPMRSWQQGATLLDWGFAVPRDASVGRLVEPGEAALAPARGKPSFSQHPPAGAGRLFASSGWLLLGGAGGGLGAGVAGAVLALRRRRRRRAILVGSGGPVAAGQVDLAKYLNAIGHDAIHTEIK